MSYADAITGAMTDLAADPRVVFVCQPMFHAGGLARTLAGVPPDRVMVLPVFEETHLGIATGMALAGAVPVVLFPRINFLLLAVNQLVNHLDKLPLIAGVRPTVLIRTLVGSPRPLDPGPQHLGDYSAALESMLESVRVERVTGVCEAAGQYRTAVDRGGGSLFIEYGHLY